MKTTKILPMAALLISSIALTTACTGMNHDENKMARTDKADMAPRSVSASEFVHKAAASDMFEVASSKLALQKSKDPQIKMFAHHMIKDHGKSTSELKMAVANSTVPGSVPKSMGEKHKAMYAELKAAKGRDFDNMYVQDQKEGHEKAIKLFTNYSENGDDEALRDFATKTLPTLHMHQEHVDNLNTK